MKENTVNKIAVLRKITVLLLAVGLGFVITASPAEARDTGWDCPGCIAPK